MAECRQRTKSLVVLLRGSGGWDVKMNSAIAFILPETPTNRAGSQGSVDVEIASYVCDYGSYLG